jgi:septal ring factor EnvC (AmiA/AmiB activator)
MNENRYPVHSFGQALDRLPLKARRKYDDLKSSLADSEALQRSLQERIQAKETRLAELAHQRDHTADATESARLDRELASVRTDLDKLERERAKRNSAR